jgi:hypothetical protein
MAVPCEVCGGPLPKLHHLRRYQSTNQEVS